MKYDANMVTLSEEEIKEYKETLANNLVALRKMLYLSQTEFGNSNNPSPAGLRILSSSTCVGLRYGRQISYTTFSRR